MKKEESNLEASVRIHLKVFNDLLLKWTDELEAMEPDDYLNESRAKTIYELKIKIKLLNSVKNL